MRDVEDFELKRLTFSRKTIRSCHLCGNTLCCK
jgi:hypothetical protein